MVKKEIFDLNTSVSCPLCAGLLKMASIGKNRCIRCWDCGSIFRPIDTHQMIDKLLVYEKVEHFTKLT